LSRGKCAERLFAKRVNKLLLETSMQIAFADFTELLLESATYLNQNSELQ